MKRPQYFQFDSFNQAAGEPENKESSQKIFNLDIQNNKKLSKPFLTPKHEEKNATPSTTETKDSKIQSPYKNGRKNSDFINPSYISNPVFYYNSKINPKIDNLQIKRPSTPGNKNTSQNFYYLLQQSQNNLLTPKEKSHFVGTDSPINRKQNLNKSAIFGQSNFDEEINTRALAKRTALQNDIFELDNPKNNNILQKSNNANYVPQDNIFELDSIKKTNENLNKNSSNSPQKKSCEIDKVLPSICCQSPRNIKKSSASPKSSVSSQISQGNDLLCPNCVNKLLSEHKNKNKALEAENKKEEKNKLLMDVQAEQNENIKKKAEKKEKYIDNMREMKRIAKEKMQNNLKKKEVDEGNLMNADQNKSDLNKESKAKQKAYRAVLDSQVKDNQKMKDLQKNIDQSETPLEFGALSDKPKFQAHKKHLDELKKQVQEKNDKMSRDKKLTQEALEKQNLDLEKYKEEQLIKKAAQDMQKKLMYNQAIKDSEKAIQKKKDDKARQQKEDLELLNSEAQKSNAFHAKLQNARDKMKEQFKNDLKHQIDNNNNKKNPSKKSNQDHIPVEQKSIPLKNCDECEDAVPAAFMTLRRLVLPSKSVKKVK